jgi:hypothetical protein
MCSAEDQELTEWRAVPSDTMASKPALAIASRSGDNRRGRLTSWLLLPSYFGLCKVLPFFSLPGICLSVAIIIHDNHDIKTANRCFESEPNFEYLGNKIRFLMM